MSFDRYKLDGEWGCLSRDFGAGSIRLSEGSGSGPQRSARPEDISDYVLQRTGLLKAERQWLSAYTVLFLYFIVILAVLLLI